ncbi:ATP-binding protein [Nostocales cyanobacterium HT-58-2]|nr:ATP-binding protein [Nostocales cyanobacterium HT-58-2]
MHLLRIQVPDFRVLKNVDITFEKEFFPSIFPLGSQNGGGKSTLLQLIFVLLHCSNEADRIPFFKNMLHGFTIHEGSNKRILATIDIWDEEKIIQLEFFSCKDSYIKDIFRSNGKSETDNTYLKYSASAKLEEIKIKISDIEQKTQILQKSLDKLEIFKNIEKDEERIFRVREEISILVRKYGFKFSSINWRTTSFLEEIQEEVKVTLEVYKLNLEKAEEESKQIERILPKVVNYLHSENLIYICNYSASGKKAEEEVILCHIDNIDMTKVESFIKNLSQKIFLAAPATQVFLFLNEEFRKLLFREQNNAIDYNSQLKEAKSRLTGFFTYDFLSVDLLIIEAFKAARDKDFREAIETGEYGNSYKLLMNDLNLMLVNKKINVSADLSGVTFKLDQSGGNVELYPEDLSHGELKRLSIYMWIKYRNIEDAIVLMDEIEIAFHPDWQYQIISDLKQWSPSNQYILATHSYDLCQALTPAHVKELEPKLLK